LTGFSRPKSANAKAADRETRVANRQLMLGNVASAQEAYCRALAWDRSNIHRRVNLARLFLVRRDWKQAAKYGESALELNSKSRAALAVVGDAWAALGKTEEARKVWLAAEGNPKASLRQSDLIVRRNMALARRVERLNDLLLAERLYRRVLLLQPEHAGATKGIARCLLKAGGYQAAEAWARRADVLVSGGS
jgi:tetratricopeptide (TPR) repeat protein